MQNPEQNRIEHRIVELDGREQDQRPQNNPDPKTEVYEFCKAAALSVAITATYFLKDPKESCLIHASRAVISPFATRFVERMLNGAEEGLIPTNSGILGGIVGMAVPIFPCNQYQKLKEHEQKSKMRDKTKTNVTTTNSSMLI